MSRGMVAEGSATGRSRTPTRVFNEVDGKSLAGGDSAKAAPPRSEAWAIAS